MHVDGPFFFSSSNSSFAFVVVVIVVVVVVVVVVQSFWRVFLFVWLFVVSVALVTVRMKSGENL